MTQSPLRYAGLSGLDLAYLEDGAGPEIVLVHGLGTSAEIWQLVHGELAQHAHVVAVDLRGAGRTRERQRHELTLRVLAEDLHEFGRMLGLSSAVVVGHSLGASVALKWAIERPEEVSGLVLLGADPNLGSLAPRMLASTGAIEEIGLRRWVDECWSKNPPFSAASLERGPEQLVAYRELVLANSPDDYVRTCRAIAAAEDLTRRLGEVEQPVVVLGGVADDRTPLERSRELADLLPNARLVELPAVGHTIPFEAPDATIEAVLSLLRP
jgi:pimeloyl-ACP methyl ester carboxylesterase